MLRSKHNPKDSPVAQWEYSKLTNCLQRDQNDTMP